MANPKKGERARINLRIPVALYADLAMYAERSGLDLNAYCQAVLDAHCRDRAAR